MRENIRRFIRSFFGLIIMGLVFSFAAAIHLWALIANYNALVQSFELIGFDQKPLADDPLYGWLFDALLLGDATQCHLYAGFLVFALAGCFAVVGYFLFNLIMLIRDRRVYLNSGDEESARQAMMVILYDNLPYLIIFLGLLVFLAWWDIDLFYYRSIAGVMNIERPEDAVNISRLGVMLREVPDNFALAVSRIGGWGYLAATLFTSLFLKFAYQRFKEKLIVFEESLLALFFPDHAGETGQAGQTSWTTAAAGAAAPPDNAMAQRDPEPAPEAEPQEDTPVTTANPDNGLRPGDNGDRAHGAAMPDASGQEVPATHAATDEETEVIGGNGNIKRSEALADQTRYHIDENGRVWDRQYYETLHGSGVAPAE